MTSGTSNRLHTAATSLMRNSTVWIAIVALAYFLAHQISFLFPGSAKVLMAVWPAGGIGLAALLLLPRRLWPASVIALFAAGTFANFLAHRPFVNSIGFMTANVLESLACAWFITRWCGKKVTFTRVKDVLALICSATLVNACTSFIGAGIAALTGIAPFWNFYEIWWVADGLGILLVTPLIVTWSTAGGLLRGFRISKALEFLFFTAAWWLLSWLLFHLNAVHHIFAPGPYILFTLVAWVSFRFGQRGVTLSLVVLAIIMVTSKAVSSGPLIWGGDTMESRLLLAQIFLGVTAVTGYLLAASYAETRSAEKTARASESNYRTLIEQASDGIFIADTDGNYTDVNSKGCAMLGYSREEVLGLNMKDVLIPEDIAVVPIRFTELRSGKAVISERRMRRKDGSVFYVEISGKKLADNRLQGIVRDITERKQMEEERKKLERQMLQTQKLESLGVLAGGIAHDFNNLLGGIFGFVDLAHFETKDNKVSGYLAKALSTIDRSRGLTQQLLTFAKGGAPVKKTGCVFPFVHDTVQFALSGSNISCFFDVQPDLWPCNFDKNQIGQVIDNIVINAMQAMPLGGKLHVSALNLTLKENEIASLREGSYVKISLRDTGLGIPLEILPRIFDPFFTTKQKGSGLGLSTCFSIINRHDGSITVESEQGKGSTFHIYLPAAPGEVVDAPAAEPQNIKGTGVILVMDDEEVIRETTSDILDTLGYSAVTAKNGQQACDIFGKAPKGFFRAVILDLTVPGGMGGKETAAAIRTIDPSVPIFVSSGYADDPVMSNPGDFGFSGSLCKPFRISDLSKMLSGHAGDT